MIATSLLLVAAYAQTLAAAPAGPEFVEPSELIRRLDLVGKEVVVDDRIRYFLESRRGQGHDELVLKRTDIRCMLPPRLKFNRPPSEPNARVLGLLRLVDGHPVLDVIAIELLPGDLERLDREVAKLRPDDFAGKRAWATWAERRGKELADPKLEARGVALEADALWTEAARPESDNLALATRSANRPVPESVRNALAHRGFRDRFAKAATSDEDEALARQIESAIPASADPKAPPVDEPARIDAYAKDPAAAYRDAPAPVRAGFDRKLLADAIERSIERQVEAKPTEAARLAEVARERLPDRPGLVDRLARRGLAEAEGRVGSMRQAEVEDLARKFREQGEEERGRRLIRSWLADRRKNRLSDSDAEGRILLAGSFDKLLGDRATAADLLREALAIDNQSRAAVDAFLRLRFRKGDAGWYDPTAAQVATPEPRGAVDRKAGPADPGDSLRGLTRAQVRNRLGGKPDLVVRSASQGRSVEQWIYLNGKGTQVVRFVLEAGTAEPRAAAYYSDRK